MDVIQRLEPVIIEIERERECVCVVAHQAILRALYGYFMKIPLAVSLLTILAALLLTMADPCYRFKLYRHSCRLWSMMCPRLRDSSCACTV